MNARSVVLLAIMLFSHLTCWTPTALCQTGAGTETSSFQVLQATAADSLLVSITDSFNLENPIDGSIKNTSANSVVLYMRELEKSIASGHRMNFCFAGLCTPSPQGTLLGSRDDTVRIAPGAVLSGPAQGFHIQYYPQNKNGVTNVKYRIENWADNRDFLDLNLKVTTTGASVGVSKTLSRPQAELSNAYPNPASGTTEITYQLPPNHKRAYLNVYDVLGKEIHREEIEEPNGKIGLNVRNYNSGLYFYSLTVDDKKLLTRRLIVNN